MSGVKGLMTGVAAAALVVPADQGDPQALLLQAQAGSRDACEELARRWRGPAYALALQLLRNSDDALDVAQESMLRFFSRLEQLAPGSDVRPWLFTIVRNQVRDFWRRQRVRRADSIDDDSIDLSAKLVDRHDSPEELAHRNQLRREVWRAMSDLPVNHREILVLRDYHGLSYDEISRVLGIKPGTVMSRLHGARKRLRAEVERRRSAGTHGSTAGESMSGTPVAAENDHV